MTFFVKIDEKLDLAILTIVEVPIIKKKIAVKFPIVDVPIT